jgi:hypothetical protein
MSIAKSASIRQAHWDCPLGETTQTRGSNFLGAAPLFRRLKLRELSVSVRSLLAGVKDRRCAGYSAPAFR